MALGNVILRDSEDSRKGIKVFDNNSIGYYGGVFIDDTAEHTPDTQDVFIAIKFVTNTQISAIEGNISGLAGASFDKGDSLLGRFTSITLTSGSIIAYEGV